VKRLVVIIVLFVGLGTGWFGKVYFDKKPLTRNPISIIKPRTLDKYTFENLAKAEIKPGEIKIENNLFTLNFSPDLTGKEVKKVTGLVNLPSGKGPFPIIVMLRGYVDQKLYQTGDGTRKAGEYFAKNGFITVAPDFLGYGESDKEAADIFETRFQTYTTVLALLNSLDFFDSWDKTNIFIWGHSNGGQIALSVLEITGKAYPTTLWAPVSQGFPQSILTYIEEADDSGKLLINKLNEFYELYDPKLYSLTNYFDKINSQTKIQIHQGTADDAVPKIRTDKLVKTLSDLDPNLDYFAYPEPTIIYNPAGIKWWKETCSSLGKTLR